MHDPFRDEQSGRAAIAEAHAAIDKMERDARQRKSKSRATTTTYETNYEIVPDTYGPQRVVFATREEAEESLSHLQGEYPDCDWRIVETADAATP